MLGLELKDGRAGAAGTDRYVQKLVQQIARIWRVCPESRLDIHIGETRNDAWAHCESRRLCHVAASALPSNSS